jgi:hypothetical protein
VWLVDHERHDETRTLEHRRFLRLKAEGRVQRCALRRREEHDRQALRVGTVHTMKSEERAEPTALEGWVHGEHDERYENVSRSANSGVRADVLQFFRVPIMRA